MENVILQVPFGRISWENIHFCGFLKKAYIANERKIKVNSTKKCVKFLSSGYFFPLYISPLMKGNFESKIWKKVKIRKRSAKFHFQRGGLPYFGVVRKFSFSRGLSL